MRRRSSAEQVHEPAVASPVHNSSKALSCLSDGDGLLFDAWGLEEQQTAVADGFYVGIDLGTTNSAAALWHLSKNRVKVLKDEGYTTMPSVVYFEDQTGTTAVPATLVGHAAVKRSAETGRRVISCAKRVIGLKYSDPTLESLSGDLAIKVVPDPQGSGGVAIELPASSDTGAATDASSKRSTVSPEHVSTLLIAALKARADAFIAKGKLPGVTAVQGCVITVPVHFPEARRRATRSAARAAGFETVVTLGESTAAAMAYGLHVAGLSKVAVIFDLGGGTLDVTVLHIKEGGRFEVISTAGKKRLLLIVFYFVDRWPYAVEAGLCGCCVACLYTSTNCQNAVFLHA
jgi:molecular chaperone DnaK (HSP70)